MYNFYTYISRNTVDHAVLTIVLVHLHISNSFCIGTWLECPLWRAKQAMTAHDNVAGIIKGRPFDGRYVLYVEGISLYKFMSLNPIILSFKFSHIMMSLFAFHQTLARKHKIIIYMIRVMLQ